jgi:hypothetical protein
VTSQPDEVAAYVAAMCERHGVPRHVDDDRVLALVAARITETLARSRDRTPATAPGSCVTASPVSTTVPADPPADPRGEDRASSHITSQ